MTPKSSSLIVCTTPLQMMIAAKIIELKRNETFDLFVISRIDNPKYRYYYDNLRKKCINSKFYIRQPGRKALLKFIIKLKAERFSRKYKNVYVSSIDSHYIQHFVSLNKRQNIYTFDDGTANIIPTSIYYSETAQNLSKELFWRVWGIKHSMQDIKHLSKEHYTIYKDTNNIIDNTCLVQLFNKDFGDIPDTITRVISVYLGQPLHEISKHYREYNLKKLLENLNINIYYPHPREDTNTIPSGNFELVESCLIFEDYIKQVLDQNPNTLIQVYSFISSAILNVAQLNRVQATYIYDSYMKDKFSEFYSFAEKSHGIPNSSIENLKIEKI